MASACWKLLTASSKATAEPSMGKRQSVEEKHEKQLDFDRKKEECEIIRISREPELLRKFDRVVESVKGCRLRKPIDSGNTAVVTSNVRENTADFICGVCGNRSNEYFFTDQKAGDTICMGVGGRGCGNVVEDHFINTGKEHIKHEV